MDDSGRDVRHESQENGHATIGQAAVTAITREVTRQDLAVIEFLDRVDRLYRELLELRDRELAVKDRLIAELERRAQTAEEHELALRDYLRNLPEDRPSEADHVETVPQAQHRWWQFWR